MKYQLSMITVILVILISFSAGVLISNNLSNVMEEPEIATASAVSEPESTSEEDDTLSYFAKLANDS